MISHRVAEAYMKAAREFAFNRAAFILRGQGMHDAAAAVQRMKSGSESIALRHILEDRRELQDQLDIQQEVINSQFARIQELEKALKK